MTYAAESSKAGRRPITIVELVLDKCANTYGIPPCTASGPAGSECYNTRGTCQDVPNYSITSKVYRFCDTRAGIPAGFEAIPCLRDISITPSKLTPGKGLGALGSVSIKLADFPHHDREIDPYVGTRAYNPATLGTYFGKLLARNPHYQGRAVKVYHGYVGSGGWDFPGDFQTRYYVIERIEGPTAKGLVTIIGKDPLKLADDDRAKCPIPTSETLTADLDATDATNFYTTDGTPYDLIGSVRIGDEVISYLLRTVGGIFGPLARGAFGSEATAHAIDDVVQQVKSWVGVPVVDVVLELLEDFTEIPPAFIAAGNLDPDGWLAGVSVNAQITEPTGVRTLLAELAEQCLFDLWWDEIDQVIRLKPLGPPLAAISIDEAGNIVEASAVVKTDPNDRISQVWLHYDQADPTQGATEDGNFNRLYIATDLNSEGAEEYGSARVQKVRSRWFKEDDAAAMGLATRLIARQKTPPVKVKLEVDAKEAIAVGDDITINTRLYQDVTGAALASNFRVVSVDPVEGGHKLQIEAETLGFPGRYARITANAQVDYGSASAAEKAAGGFIAPTVGNFGDGGAPYKVL